MKVRTIFTIIAAGVLVLALLTTRGGFSRMQILSHKFPAISGHTAMPPPGTSFEPSTGNARQKYERAVNLPPNWATQECVDIIVRYPDSPEATLAANMLIDKWDHILHRDFLTLTGRQLPVDYDMSRDEVVA